MEGYQELAGHQADIEARMRSMGDPRLSLGEFIDLVYDSLGLDGDKAEAGSRLDSKLLERTESNDRYGRPFAVSKWATGLSIGDQGGHVKDGVYACDEDRMACLVRCGWAIGVLAHGEQSYAFIEEMGGWVLDRSDPVSVPFRKARKYDVNPKRSRLVKRHVNAAGSKAIAALAQFSHRYYLAEQGVLVLHAEHGLIANVERHKREKAILRHVMQLFPGERVVQNYRGPELGGLELDIYMPRRAVAIEHQGQQHYEAVAHWGGEEALAERREHDARKRVLCAELGIVLIEIRYDEAIDPASIARRLCGHIG